MAERGERRGDLRAVVAAVMEHLGQPDAHGGVALHVAALAVHHQVGVRIEAPLDDYVAAASLTVLATQTTGEPDDALADPLRFATIAGQRLARLA